MLVRKLIDSQFPQWKEFQIRPVAHGGWDNRTFHLGDQMLVRMPSADEYAPKVAKEFRWLPILAPLLPFQISRPLVMGQPGNGYPWPWSVYHWIEGEAAGSGHIENLADFAKHLARFLIALQKIDTTNGPLPGPDTTSRGGPLTLYDDETRQALVILKNKIDANAALEVWQAALATFWNRPPVWVHGDISVGNILVRNGKLNAVIDFGGLVVGDPACDLAIAWTLFKGESRKMFCDELNLDEGTWARGRGWALWKALIVAAEICETNTMEGKDSLRIIDEVLEDYRKTRISV